MLKDDLCFLSAAAHPGSVDKRTLQEQTALLLAVSRDQLSCVRCLLDSGADPDICSSNKETPLYKGTAVKSEMLWSAMGYVWNRRMQRGVEGAWEPAPFLYDAPNNLFEKKKMESAYVWRPAFALNINT